MPVLFWLRSFKYKKLISTDQFKHIIKSYIDYVNSVMISTVDYIDKDKDGYISTAEILYLVSALNKKISRMLKAIK